jgi:hypothetical protein
MAAYRGVVIMSTTDKVVRYNGKSWPGNVPARDLSAIELQNLGLTVEQAVGLGCFEVIKAEKVEETETLPATNLVTTGKDVKKRFSNKGR